MSSRSLPVTFPSRRQLLQQIPVGALASALGMVGFDIRGTYPQEPEATSSREMTMPEPIVLNPTPTEVIDLPSTQVDQTYRLFISLPPSYAQSTLTYPVIYILDGNALFPLVRTATELLQIPQEVPEVILVGIGYPEPTYMDTLGRRGRDMTFHELSRLEIGARGYPFEETGGGAQFLDFVQGELLPFIEQNYRVNANHRGLFGWSLGGDFVLYTMFLRPGLFERLASFSPSIDYRAEGIGTFEDQYAQAHTSLAAKLFLAHEEPTPDFHTFVETLKTKNLEGFSMNGVVYEEEDHFSMVPRAVTDALRTLFSLGGRR